MNEKNLIPNSERTPKELREMTRKGGIKSGESRRAAAELRKKLAVALQNKYTNKDTGEQIEGTEAIILALMSKAMNKKDKDQLNAIKYIMTVLGADKLESEIARQEAETKLINAKVDMLTGADTTALDKLDELLKEQKDNANTERETE